MVLALILDLEPLVCVCVCAHVRMLGWEGGGDGQPLSVWENKGQRRVEGGRQYQREGKSRFPSHTQTSALKVWCTDQRWSPNHCHQSATGQGQKARVSI